jgi:hypothetical protein
MAVQINVHPHRGEIVYSKTTTFETFIALDIEGVTFFLDFDQLRQIGDTINSSVDSHLEAVALAKFDARRDSEYSLA